MPGMRPLTAGMAMIPAGTLVGESPWKLKVTLCLDVKQDDSGCVVIHHTVDEYGIGGTIVEAELDLLKSLADYRSSLEKRRDRLAEEDAKNLHLLEEMMEPK